MSTSLEKARRFTASALSNSKKVSILNTEEASLFYKEEKGKLILR